MLAYIPYMDPMGTDMYFNVHFFSSVVGRHGPATHRRVSSYSTIPQTMRTMRTMRMEKKPLGAATTPSARVKTQFLWMYIDGLLWFTMVYYGLCNVYVIHPSSWESYGILW